LPSRYDAGYEEQTPTLRGATAMRLLMTRKRMTATELAQELRCSPRTAYRVLERLELSRRFILVYERPYFYLEEAGTAEPN
jgi:predicted ArsR family transcriptional regulator